MVRPLSLIKKLTEAWRLVGHRRSGVSDVISITEVQGTLGNGSYQMEQEAEVLVWALNVKLCICMHVSVRMCALKVKMAKMPANSQIIQKNNKKNKYVCQNPFKIKHIREDPHTFCHSKINVFATFWYETFIKLNEMLFCFSWCFWDCLFNVLHIVPGKENQTDSLISIPRYDFEPRSETIRDKNCFFSIVQLQHLPPGRGAETARTVRIDMKWKFFVAALNN